MVKAIKQHIHGRLFIENGRSALLITSAKPTTETAVSLYLRYAFTLQGVETPILPAFVLDDWGKEIRGLAVYDWVRKFGEQFPRAELFGFTVDGDETQCFLRELELVARLLCYAYPAKETPLPDGVLVEAILWSDESVSASERIKRPSVVKRPLRSANVNWWRVNPATVAFDLSFLGSG